MRLGLMNSNIGGSTLHSWSGIGLGKFPVAKLTEMIRKNNVAVERWRTTGALIIDESELGTCGRLSDMLIHSIDGGWYAV
jgi:ATP-dependent DNA helicase PIF1